MAKRQLPSGRVALVASALASLPSPAHRQRVCAECFTSPGKLLRSKRLGGLCFCAKACMASMTARVGAMLPVLERLASMQLPWGDGADLAEAAAAARGGRGSTSWVADRATLELGVHVAAALIDDDVASARAAARDLGALHVHAEACAPGAEVGVSAHEGGALLARLVREEAPETVSRLCHAASEVVPSSWRPAGEGADALALMCAHILLAIRFNAHPARDARLGECGTGLFPAAALANHACEPSAVALSIRGHELAVVTLRSVAEGEEVTLAYVDPCQPRALRRSLLARGFRFACSCTRCAAPLRRTHRDAMLTAFTCECGGHFARPDGSCVDLVTRADAGLTDDADTPPICASGRDLVRGSGPGAWVEGAAAGWQRELASGDDEELRCSSCGASQRAGALCRAAAEVFAGLRQAVALGETDAARGMQAALQCTRADAFSMLHAAHRARLDVALALMSMGARAEAWHVAQQAAREAVSVIESVGPRSGGLALAAAYHAQGHALLRTVEAKYGPLVAALQRAEGARAVDDAARLQAQLRQTASGEQALFTDAARALQAALRLRSTLTRPVSMLERAMGQDWARKGGASKQVEGGDGAGGAPPHVLERESGDAANRFKALFDRILGATGGSGGAQ